MGIAFTPPDPGAGSGGSAAVEKLPDFGWAINETGIGNAFPMIPELSSPKKGDGRRTLGSKKEISEAVLSEGFTFPPRDLPRPGQFTNIQRHNLFTKPPSPPHPEPSLNLPGSPPKDKTMDTTARASPLDLPEICLSGNPRDADAAHKHGGEAEISQRDENVRWFGLSNSPIFFMSPGSTKSKVMPDSRSHETDKTPRLMSPPKLASSPTQSHNNNNLFKAISHKMVTREQDGPSSAPRMKVFNDTKSQNVQRQRTPSICGDLELPTYRSPLESRPKDPKKYKESQVVFLSRDAHERPSHRRSGSTTSSNISKKRSRDHKSEHKSKVSRDQRAIQCIGDFWNQCIELADEETEVTRSELRRLKKILQGEQEKLGDIDKLLKAKDAELSALEARYSTLFENNNEVTKEKERLGSELTCLKEQLSEEKKQGKLANDKCDAYRRKLNETIREQGVLFRRAETYYKDTMDQLRKENEHKTASSEAVDEALKNSLKIREEMKKCTDEYRTQMEQDVKRKDQVISELKEKLHLQEALWAQEKTFADKLSVQTKEQDAVHQLDSLLAGGNQLASKMLSQENLELKLAIAEKNIVKSLLPVIFSLESEQSNVSKAVSQLGGSIRQDLDRFKGEASRIVNALEQDEKGTSARFQELSSHIQNFDCSLKKAVGSCENIGQRFDVLAGNEQSNQRETISMLQEVLQRISAHENKSNETDQQLQQAYEELTKKVEAMMSEAMKNGEETIEPLSSAITDLRATLEQGLGLEREKTAQLLQVNENVLNVLTTHISEQKHIATQDGDRISELQATLENERETAAQLRNTIQAFEQKAQETEILRDEWLKDVQTIDKMRSQLKAIAMRIPQVENCDKKLDRIMEISRSIQSSASYLATEEEWVQLENADRMPNPAASDVVTSCEVSTTLLPLLAESDGAAEIQPSTKEDVMGRKVTVYSPDPGERSPSPPLTVIQEQKRRREVTQLRSILKSHAIPATVEPASVEGHSTRSQTDQSKVSQTANVSINKSQSASTKEMVAEIRSRLIQHNHTWTFPTVADFERDIQLSSKKRQAPQGNPVSLESFDSNPREMKKPRTEHYIQE
ncbi:hypothetical protein M431DRAFT_82529 [Trichoderma harzianum CBS 226.95]|uniref:Uncharacterized protein n=1 Tax=Trichoderma harzianum CBS 226.95 TaxID=983964 RepID=A0A2T4AG78_TRIHA|nr:hypothetical protein M431DRAFT_82529 [Trichoderma harzianum CBS 226.95]PTB56033.1 hypothetical protein M431DRAFT_82529 [Trichoderma harzianum CBS 226.95]